MWRIKKIFSAIHYWRTIGHDGKPIGWSMAWDIAGAWHHKPRYERYWVDL